MDNAYPADELDPISCKGKPFESTKIGRVTLVDTLDTLAIMGDKKGFTSAVNKVCRELSFDLDVNVNVFETTIRILGGLLSAHIMASDTALSLWTDAVPYDGFLLDLALDLGVRLLPAFNTNTGIPYGTINLKKGVPLGETLEACTAGAGSLYLEFGMLSALTGDSRFATAARKATIALHSFRADSGLVGKHINITTGRWTEKLSGIGSNSDSFYEYLVKAYLLFGDTTMWVIFSDLYGAVMKYNKIGSLYFDVYISNKDESNSVRGTNFDNLSAFWPGIQVEAGDYISACDTLNTLHDISGKEGFLPEEFNGREWQSYDENMKGGYLLRPELIESTFHMEVASEDNSWLVAGKRILSKIKSLKTECGFASLEHVSRRQLHNAMPSFFLSETLKYLYLLFDKDNFIRKGHYVFTTEAHPFPLMLKSNGIRQPSQDVHRAYDNPQCVNPDTLSQDLNGYLPFSYMCSYRGALSTTNPAITNYVNMSKLSTSLLVRPPIAVAEQIITEVSSMKTSAASASQSANNYKLDGGALGPFTVLTSPDSPGFRVRRDNTGDAIVLSGIDKKITMIYDNKHMDANGHPVAYSTLLPAKGPMTTCTMIVDKLTVDTQRRSGDNGSKNTELHPPQTHLNLGCVVASFGLTASTENVELQFRVIRSMTDDGCEPYTPSYAQLVRRKVVIVKRGICTFQEKVDNALKAGASGVVVINNVPGDPFLMTGDREDVKVPIVLISQEQGLKLWDRVTNASQGKLTISNTFTAKSPFLSYGEFASESVSESIFSFLKPKRHGLRIYHRNFQWGVNLTIIKGIFSVVVLPLQDLDDEPDKLHRFE
jgi:hypothetical protein